MVFNMAE